jgi:hypothetical protein
MYVITSNHFEKVSHKRKDQDHWKDTQPNASANTTALNTRNGRPRTRDEPRHRNSVMTLPNHIGILTPMARSES